MFLNNVCSYIQALSSSNRASSMEVTLLSNFALLLLIKVCAYMLACEIFTVIVMMQKALGVRNEW